jgi:TolB-like protein/Flp pilus assembly protein TadD
VSAIAVLPFVDLSPEGDQAYFADGIAEEILNILAQYPELRVVARTSAFKFRGEDFDLREVGKALNANRIIEGSVRTAGTRVRITAQLIDSDTNLHLWSETFDRELTDIFALQDEIAEAISSALGVRLGVSQATPEEAVARNVTDADAYHLYLQGRKALAERAIPGRLAEAITLLEQSVAADPELDAAYGSLTLAHALTPWYQLATGDEAIRNALVSADKALSLNPDSFDALLGKGYALAVHGMKIAEGEALMLLALQLRPNDLTANNLTGDLYRFTGERDLALKYDGLAAELDPLDAIQQADLAWTLIEDSNWEQALIHARRGTALEPRNHYSPQAEVWCLIFLGELDSAEARLDEVLEVGSYLLGAGDVDRTMLAIARGDDELLPELVMKARASIDEHGWGHIAHANLSNVIGDLEGVASHLQAAMDGGSRNFMLDYSWSFGVVDELAQAGHEMEYPARSQELLERIRVSPWSAQRLHQQLVNIRDREPAK